MKHHNTVSKFLEIDLKKETTGVTAQCEVVAVGPAVRATSKGFTLQKSALTYKPLVERLVESEELSTKAGALCLARFSGIRGGAHVLLVSPGVDKEGVNALGALERFRRLGALIVTKLNAEKIKSAAIYFDSFLLSSSKLATDQAAAAYAFLEGMALASYKFKKYISKPKDEKEFTKLKITLIANDHRQEVALSKGMNQASSMTLGAEICRDFGNEPSNELYPEVFAKRAKALAEEHHLEFKELDEKILHKEKMGLLLGVGQGSIHPPRLFMLKYNAPGKSKKTIAFVGKGITFDSGGISIKPSSKMEDMKHDMCGGAAVIGAIVACAQLKIKTNVIAVIAAAENMPDGRAIAPGNILYSRSGKTVEISNTDAEGRLVLADALDYVQDLNPDYIIDLATLTGAVQIALGKSCAGLLGNDPKFNRLVTEAAKNTGERVWELPLYEEYFDDLKSEYADMRNSGDLSSHGVMKGAMFLYQYIRKGTRWAHLDIAATAYDVSSIPYNPRKASTGYGVRLLTELAQKLS